MNWSFLSFLGEPWFVIPWYAAGVLSMAYVIHDLRASNTVLKTAMKWAWPIVVFFFSVVGLALYFATARAPGVGRMQSEDEKQRAHERYERSMWRRTNGAVIHCVAGDGFGIMTAMVIARAGGMSFWQEFWFEYAVGFAIGWLVFQRKSMTMMTDSLAKQLAMAFRAEFFSMLTVMAGMGAVMTYVTPMVVTAQPKPLTYAFWGFGMFGLLVGAVLTFPTNWLMVKIGWKHGMGSMQSAKEVEVKGTGPKAALLGGLVAIGCAALLLPAWLTRLREQAPLRGQNGAPVIAPDVNTGLAAYDGIHATLGRALQGLKQHDRTKASMAMDEALRAAEVGGHSAPGSFYSALEEIRNARLALQQGSESRSAGHLRPRATSSGRPAS